MGNTNPFIFKARKNIAWVPGPKQAINFRLESQQSCLLTVRLWGLSHSQSMRHERGRVPLYSQGQPSPQGLVPSLESSFLEGSSIRKWWRSKTRQNKQKITALPPQTTITTTNNNNKNPQKTMVIAKYISHPRRKGSSWKPELVKFSEPDREKEQISLGFCCLYLSVWS